MHSKILKSLREARSELLNKVDEWILSVWDDSPKISKILRHEIHLKHAQPLEWLILQDCPKKIFWENRTQKEQFAGIGSALDFKDGGGRI